MDEVDLRRPTGRAAPDLVAASQWRALPPRLPDVWLRLPAGHFR
jgi:hypothetical protein